jgi:sugar/nucleoside kinase (ribokinase family)
MGNRSKQAHLSTGQVSELRRDVRAAARVSVDSYKAELLRYARKYGLRIDTVAEVARSGHKERTR